MSKADQHKVIILGVLMAVLVAVIWVKYRQAPANGTVIQQSSGDGDLNTPSLSIPGLTYTPSDYSTGSPMYTIPQATLPGMDSCCDSCAGNASTGGIQPFSFGDLVSFLQGSTSPGPTIAAVQAVAAQQATPQVPGTPWTTAFTLGSEPSGPGSTASGWSMFG